MIEDAIQRSEPIWQFIHDYQPLIAGLLALAAAAFTTAFLWRQSHAIAEEGKRERAFKIRRHEIDTQNKRHAAAVALIAEIDALVKINDFEYLAKNLETRAERFACSEYETDEFPSLVPIDESFMNVYHDHIMNMSLLAPETAAEVACFYHMTMRLCERIKSADKIMRKGISTIETRAASLYEISDTSEQIAKQAESVLSLLKQDATAALKNVDRLKSA